MVYPVWIRGHRSFQGITVLVPRTPAAQAAWGAQKGDADGRGGVLESPVERGRWDPTAKRPLEGRGVVARERMGTGHVQAVCLGPRDRLSINPEREALQKRNPVRGLRHR